MTSRWMQSAVCNRIDALALSCSIVQLFSPPFHPHNLIRSSWVSVPSILSQPSSEICILLCTQAGHNTINDAKCKNLILFIWQVKLDLKSKSELVLIKKSAGHGLNGTPFIHCQENCPPRSALYFCVLLKGRLWIKLSLFKDFLMYNFLHLLSVCRNPFDSNITIIIFFFSLLQYFVVTKCKTLRVFFGNYFIVDK